MLRGYSGYNTRWALKVLERAFPGRDDGGEAPIAVTVFFGANDACLPDRCSAFQHVPLDEYKQNLRSIVSFLKVPSFFFFFQNFSSISMLFNMLISFVKRVFLFWGLMLWVFGDMKKLTQEDDQSSLLICP